MGFKWPFYLNVHLYYFSDSSIKKMLNKYDFELIKSFPHVQYLQLGYLCSRAKKYFSLFSYVEKLVKILKLSNLSVPYNLGQTTFIFKN